MTPPHGSSICPICLHVYQALAQHLKRAHGVFNLHERRLLLSMASGRVNIRQCPCPVSGCSYHSTRLDQHLLDGHPELTRTRLLNEEHAVRKAAVVQLLGCLRATNPRVAMVSALDLVVCSAEDRQVVGEVDPGVVVACQMPACVSVRAEHQENTATMERLERESTLHLKTIKVQARKLRRYQLVVRGMNEAAAGSREKEVEQRPEEVVAGPSRQLPLQLHRITFKGRVEVKR
ncbi:uncharacterized protein LOC130207832 [Pseudoliparis swirei]|uniref:uncharacterized protein LOC130207832 n=1 Tax=Pseudoliparis swirei TaxID=2059687 RepID=UPI0024BEDF20|nr:uncharacterized protein LOC130207832 [Pseudoliparis swirei]